MASPDKTPRSKGNIQVQPEAPHGPIMARQSQTLSSLPGNPSLPPRPTPSYDARVEDRRAQTNNAVEATQVPTISQDTHHEVVATLSKKLLAVEEQLEHISNVRNHQRDLQKQMNSLRTHCDHRVVEEAQQTARFEVAQVDKLLHAHCQNVANLTRLFKETQNCVGGFHEKITDVSDRVSVEKQARIDFIQSHETDVRKLSRDVVQLTTQREAMGKELEERKQKQKATDTEVGLVKKSLEDVVKRLSKVEAGREREFRMPERKRQASVSEPVSHVAKRAKGPVRTPSVTDHDSDDEPLSATRRRAASTVLGRGPSLTPSRAPRQAPSVNQANPFAKPTTSAVTQPANRAGTAKPTKLPKQEPAPGTARPARESTPEGLSKVARDKFRYIRALKDFDCTDFPKYRLLREDYLDATYQFPLFKLEIKNDMYEFLLQTGSSDSVEPCPREQVDGVPKEWKQTADARKIVKGLGVIEGRTFGPRGRVLASNGASHYFLCLGEVYKSVLNSKTSKKESTGWFVFIDVADKAKPVFMIWREKTYRAGKLVSSATWNGNIFGLDKGRRDCFLLLQSVSEWPANPNHLILSDEQVKKALDLRGRETHMQFTRPLCNYLVERIEDGWGKSVTWAESIRVAGPATSAANPKK